MPGTQNSQSQAAILALGELGAKTLDAVSAIAGANQRVLGQLIELSSIAATDRLRTLGELQSAAVDAARGSLLSADGRDALGDLPQDPVGWYNKSVLSAVDGAQRMLKLFESNAQIVTRSAQRFQGSAERTSKEIQDAVTACATRLQEIAGSRS
jgi:hypothetical protein